MSRFGRGLRRGALARRGLLARCFTGWRAGTIRFAPAHARLLWRHGRPVLFLTGLCILAGVMLSSVSAVLGLTFLVAGLGALALCLWMVRPLGTEERPAARRELN
jgi:hypothetical protein